MNKALLDPNDSGEIKRAIGETRRNIGETTVRITMPDAPGEATQNLNPYLIPTNPWPVVIRREVEDTEIIIAETIAVVDLPDTAAVDLTVTHPRDFDGTPPPPPQPLPPNPDETGINIFGGLGADLPQPRPEPEPEEDGDDVVFRRGCGGGQPQPRRSRWSRGRHATPATFLHGLLIGAGLATAIYSGVILAALAVIR